jgi:hypothetical protein
MEMSSTTPFVSVNVARYCHYQSSEVKTASFPKKSLFLLNLLALSLEHGK